MNSKVIMLAGAALALPVSGAFAQATSSPVATTGSEASAAGTTASSSAQPSASTPTGATSEAAAASGPSGGKASAAPSAAAQSSASQSGATSVATVTAADLKKGTPVMDTQGGSVGTIESVTANAAVVSTGAARAQIPLSGFGKTDKGIVLGMTKAELEKAAAGAKPAQGGS